MRSLSLAGLQLACKVWPLRRKARQVPTESLSASNPVSGAGQGVHAVPMLQFPHSRMLLSSSDSSMNDDC